MVYRFKYDDNDSSETNEKQDITMIVDGPGKEKATVGNTAATTTTTESNRSSVGLFGRAKTVVVGKGTALVGFFGRAKPVVVRGTALVGFFGRAKTVVAIKGTAIADLYHKFTANEQLAALDITMNGPGKEMTEAGDTTTTTERGTEAQKWFVDFANKKIQEALPHVKKYVEFAQEKVKETLPIVKGFANEKMKESFPLEKGSVAFAKEKVEESLHHVKGFVSEKLNLVISDFFKIAMIVHSGPRKEKAAAVDNTTTSNTTTTIENNNSSERFLEMAKSVAVVVGTIAVVGAALAAGWSLYRLLSSAPLVPFPSPSSGKGKEKWMVAPGTNGEYQLRLPFENKPRDYFKQLRKSKKKKKRDGFIFSVINNLDKLVLMFRYV